jgi:hypothetical protein
VETLYPHSHRAGWGLLPIALSARGLVLMNGPAHMRMRLATPVGGRFSLTSLAPGVASFSGRCRGPAGLRNAGNSTAGWLFYGPRIASWSIGSTPIHLHLVPFGGSVRFGDQQHLPMVAVVVT